MTPSSNIVDQQVDDLRERMKLLQQDRRANVDILEAKKSSNSEEIKNLRDENKAFRLKLTHLQKRLTSNRGGQHELATLQRDALQLRTEFDALKVTSTKNQQKLDKLKDEAKACELEAKQPNHEDGPLARNIRTLENRLDKAMIKYNEAQSISSTYEQIVKRLKEERVSFNNQLTALERTLKAKKRDHDDLLLLAGDANHAREVAQHELHQARVAYEENRTRREADLRERQHVVKIRRQMIEKQDRRDAKKAEEAAHQNLENTIGNEGRDSMHSVWGNDPNASFLMLNEEKIAEEEEKKLETYEEAFRKIKDATGVSDVNDVIEKMKGQQNTKDNLVSLTKQNQARIEQLQAERDAVREAVDEICFNGKVINATRKMVDDKEEELAAAMVKMERAKSTYEQTTNTLISAKGGVKHLQNKLETIGKEVHAEQSPFTESNLGGALWSVGNIVVEVMARIRQWDISDFHKNDEDEGSSSDSDFDEEDMQEMRPYNQRIILPSAKDNLYDADCSDDSRGYGDVDEEELSRDRVKKASSQILRSQQRKKAREKG